MLTLRATPIPALAFHLNTKHFEKASEISSLLTRADPEIHRRRLGDAENRVLVQMAFAACYGLSAQLARKTEKNFLWDDPFDFKAAGMALKIIASPVSEKWGNTGPATLFRIHKRVLEKKGAQGYVLAALDVPWVHFLGWMPPDSVKPHLVTWGAEIPAGSAYIEPLWELPVEISRIAGAYV